MLRSIPLFACVFIFITVMVPRVSCLNFLSKDKKLLFQSLDKNVFYVSKYTGIQNENC